MAQVGIFGATSPTGAIASGVTIANRSLSLLGENQIASLQDNTATARLCLLHLPEARDAAFAEHNWNFAKVQVALVSTGVKPVHTWSFEYTLPADIVRIVRPAIMTDDYEVLGNKLLTNWASMSITYIKRVTDPDDWPALFQEAVVFKLAGLIAPVLKADQEIEVRMEQLFQKSIIKAKIWDAQEESTMILEADDLITIRFHD